MRLVILGAGGHGQVVADVARQTKKYSEIIFLDDNCPCAAGKCDEFLRFADSNTEMYAAFGNNELRLSFLDRFKAAGIRIARIIHPLSYISPTATLSDGCCVLPYAIINTDCKIARGCIINCGSIVDHGCVVNEGVHVSPGAIIKAENKIPARTKIESGEVIPIRHYPLEVESK